MSGSIFIITGMPRARTAWIANYMMQGSVFCMHELLSKFESPQGCAEWMKHSASFRDGVGMSDSGAVYFQRALAKELPDARWVAIRRKKCDSEQSFRSEHGLEVPLTMHERMLDELIDQRKPLVIDFDEIDSRMFEIAEYCVPGWKHDPLRHAMLSGFNIKLTDRSLKSGITYTSRSELMKHMELPTERKAGE